MIWYRLSFCCIIIGLILLSACGSDAGSQASKNHNGEETVNAVVDKEVIKKMITNHSQSTDIDPVQIFKERCALCHGVKGNLGVNGAGDLTQSSLNLEERVSIIYYGKNTMTPFKGILTDEEIVELALFVALLRQQ